MDTISKSKFLSGLQCPKLLWHLAHAPTELPAVDDATQATFDQGAEIGRLARTLFPDGILIDHDGDPEQAIIDTQAALDARKPVFEGAFGFQGAYCRVDILVPVAGDQWDLVEVKSTTGVEDVHLHDVAFQAWVLAGAEMKLRRCWVMQLDSGYIRQGDLDPAKLFKRVDVTSQVQALGRDIEDQLDDQAAVIRMGESPEVEIGKHCEHPYTCPLKEKCWSFLPDHNVFKLYRGGNRSWQLFRDRIRAIKDIPDDLKLTTNQAIQRQAVQTGKPHVNRPALRKFLARLTYPVHYLDFETINPAIPMYDGSSPYSQVPFQFSLHIQPEPDSEPIHHSFLADGSADPRMGFLEALVRHIAPAGSVVAYNAGFELRVLRECCELMPFQPWLASVERRVIDLLVPFRAFHFYHPDQGGSASMKAVLPALTGGGYDHLTIQDGGTASREFVRVVLGEITPEERRRIREDLERYCALDTLGMVEIVQELRSLTNG